MLARLLLLVAVAAVAALVAALVVQVVAVALLLLADLEAEAEAEAEADLAQARVPAQVVGLAPVQAQVQARLVYPSPLVPASSSASSPASLSDAGLPLSSCKSYMYCYDLKKETKSLMRWGIAYTLWIHNS